MTTLVVYDHDIRYNEKSSLVDESQLISMATKIPNVRHLRINGPVHDLTPEGADRAAQLWSRVEELDLRGSHFDVQVLGNFTRRFPHLKSLKIDNIYGDIVQLFDSIFSNHPNLVDFECLFRDYLLSGNCFRSCDVPLERFSVKKVWHEKRTLDTLESCCKDSLQSISFLGEMRSESQAARRLFSTFQQLREVSLSVSSFSDLTNQSVLPLLEKLCIDRFEYADEFSEGLIDFLKSYPQLKEFHLKEMQTDIEAVKNISATLPNLQSLSFFYEELNSTVLKSLTSLKKLEHFNFGYPKNVVIEHVQAFVRQMPSLQRLSCWRVNGGSIDEYLEFYKSIRDEIRSSGSNRRLWVGLDGGRYFPLDSSEACTDMAIEEFVKELKSKTWEVC